MEGVRDHIGGMPDQTQVITRRKGPGNRPDPLFPEFEIGASALCHFNGIDGKSRPPADLPGRADDGFVIPDIIDKDISLPDPSGRGDPDVFLLVVQKGRVKGKVYRALSSQELTQLFDAVD